jgi:hypothetical protein
MKPPEEGDLVQRCVERLRELPFVEGADLHLERAGRSRRADGVIRIVTPTVKREFMLEVKKTHLTRTVVDGVMARIARDDRPRWILFAPHVGRPLAKYLAEQGANFIDAAGNCRLRIDRRYLATVEGRPQEPRLRQGRGIGVPGLQVLFALLVRPTLVNAPVRVLAAAAGVAAATAANRVVRLREEGLIAVTKQRRLMDPRRILEQWLKGYETQMRPRLMIGRYRTPDEDPEALERHIAEVFDEKMAWAWGGGAAAHRLTGYYRGLETVVHVPNAPNVDLMKALRALRANDGPLIILKAPGPIAFESEAPRTVHPLLVYTELLFQGDKRAGEAATEVQKRYLAHLA